MKERLAAAVVAAVPRILSLLDKNRYSPTYGCLDRKYWHYKIIDFPSGMQQELALPLAYAWMTPGAGNRYHRLPRLREHLEGILSYHAVCSRADGSLDDYFPGERAFGATAYALAALSDAALLTGLGSDAVNRSLARSGEFLVRHRESGTLSNHLAIAAAALANLEALTGDSRWRQRSDEMVAELASLQHEEGWFPEYEGCDLGYQTVTVEFLARRHQRAPSVLVLRMLESNVRFLRAFMHPDGSFGGEYGSRNTYNFYPGGFAILSAGMPEAAQLLGSFVKGLERGTANHLEDDGVVGHLLSSYVTVLLCTDARVERSATEPQPGAPRLRHFAGAGLFAARAGSLSLFGSTTKGGVFKVFDGEELLGSDTGFVGELLDGTRFCQNTAGASRARVGDDEIAIEGSFRKFSMSRMNPTRMIGLRLLYVLFGRFGWYSNAIRSLMQKVLVYGGAAVPAGFSRTIRLGPGEVRVRDEIVLAPGMSLARLHRSTDCVNMHVVTSDSFQAANLLPWEEVALGGGGAPPVLEKLYRGCP